MEQTSVSVARYVKIYAVWYFGVVVAVVALWLAFKFDSGAVASAALIFGAALQTAQKFISEQKRTPTTQEKRSLVWGSILCSMVLPALGLLAIATSEFPQLNGVKNGSVEGLSVVGISMLILLFAIALHYIVFSIVYGYGAKALLKQEERIAAKRSQVKTS